MLDEAQQQADSFTIMLYRHLHQSSTNYNERICNHMSISSQCNITAISLMSITFKCRVFKRESGLCLPFIIEEAV